ncbi:MAG: PAS domain S-box protein, partial [Oligoflexia bacterium]|nr:PAS domain S-box protein [Oligoflexia bacterium]
MKMSRAKPKKKLDPILFFKKMLSYSLDIICAIDESGSFLSVSPACEKIWGYTEFELLNLPRLSLVHPDDLESTINAIQNIISGMEPINFENRFIHKNNNIVHMQWAARWSLEDKMIYCIARDVTQEKLFQEQLMRTQRVESIGSLAGGVAHDLNNIFAPIMLNASILAMRNQSPECAKAICAIESNAKRGAEMVKQVLSFARGTEGKKGQFAPKEIVDQVIKIAEDTFDKRFRVISE